MLRVTSLLLLLLAASVRPVDGTATSPLPLAGPEPAPDSARVLASARAAQARFERFRQSQLPWTFDGGGGPCDERVGRFCIWHGGGRDDDWEPPREPGPVVERRDALIAELAEAAALLPGDGWIAGQRVRYLVEAGRTGEALAVARGCRAEGWWCAALEGAALHYEERFAESDSVFTLALLRMPSEERRRWTDLSVLLDSDGLREYRRLDREERDAFEARAWWLADPLYMVPGNDRRTEHYTRWVRTRIHARARGTDGISWGSDLHELLLRYGEPASWERVRPRSPSLQRGAPVVSRYPPRSRRFAPPLDAVLNPFDITPEDWPLDLDGARTGYAPAYAGGFSAPKHQVALFRRADSVVVVAGYSLDVAGDTPPAEVQAALVLATGPAHPPATALVHGGPVGTLRVSAAAAPAMASLEALLPAEKTAYRVRYGVDAEPLPPGEAAVSDLLLLADADPLPSSLAEAARAARGSTEVRAGEAVGVFWEVYGLAADAEIRFTVSVARERGRWRRLGERLGILRRESPMRLRWGEEGPEEAGILSRSVSLSLSLTPGSYTLLLEVDIPGREPLHASRDIEIVDASPEE